MFTCVTKLSIQVDFQVLTRLTVLLGTTWTNVFIYCPLCLLLLPSLLNDLEM